MFFSNNSLIFTSPSRDEKYKFMIFQLEEGREILEGTEDAQGGFNFFHFTRFSRGNLFKAQNLTFRAPICLHFTVCK